ncbi:MAG: helix-hairpin-helix domain-containing protein [Flavitalea sp.]
MKEQLRAYFSFSRKERIGIIVLIVLICGAGVVPAVIPATSGVEDSASFSEFRRQLAMLELPSDTGKSEDRGGKWKVQSQDFDRTSGNGHEYPSAATAAGSYAENRDKPRELFYFDPNTLDAKGWGRLGVRDKTIATISKYISKGGSFRKPEDLLKVYGLSEKDKEALLPFVRITRIVPSEQSDPPTREYSTPPSFAFTPKLPPVRLDINLADSLTWQRLPGIGKSLSARIVKFRDRLGGFTSTEQVRDVYGIHDTVFQKIEKWLFLEVPPKKIRLNLVAVNELATHPYCGTKLAKTIIEFRNQHGPFRQTTDLKQLASLSPEQYNKLIPYLEIN